MGQAILAQDSLDRKHLLVKIAPLTIFDIDNTFEFAVEHRLGKKTVGHFRSSWAMLRA